MITRETLIQILNPLCDNAEHFSDKIIENTVHLGKTVYVVTQYSPRIRNSFEVVEGVVTCLRYDPRKDKKYFVVEGKWGNGNYYNATFRQSSIHKTVHFSLAAAQDCANQKNAR